MVFLNVFNNILKPMPKPQFNQKTKSGHEFRSLMIPFLIAITHFQQLGFVVYRLVIDAKCKAVSSDDVETAYRLLSGFNRDQYKQPMLTVSDAQKKLFITLAHERTREFDDAYRSRYLLGASSTVNSAKKNDGIWPH